MFPVVQMKTPTQAAKSGPLEPPAFLGAKTVARGFQDFDIRANSLPLCLEKSLRPLCENGEFDFRGVP
jgi:hypothetical protein